MILLGYLHRVVFAGIMGLFLSSAVAHAEQLVGKASIAVDPMVLIERDESIEIAAMKPGATFKNMRSLGALKHRDLLVRIRYSEERSGVKLADEIELLPPVYFDQRMSFQHTEEFTFYFSGAGKGAHLLIDPRERAAWEAGHLPGAVSMPQAHLTEADLPQDKGRMLIFYSDGPQSSTGHEAARKALAWGYRNIKFYNEGFAGWTSEGNIPVVSAAHVERMMMSGTSFLLIDVRSAVRIQDGHIPGAISIPGETMERRDVYIEGRPYQLPLVVYGDSDNDPAAMRTAQRIAAWGYHREASIGVLDGGFESWRKSGRQVEKGDIAKNRNVAPSPASGEIAYEEFKKIWNKRDGKILLLNVLPSMARHFDWELHIPVGELYNRLDEIPKNREVVAYCSIGMQAQIAYHILKRNGFNRVRFLYRDPHIRYDGSISE